jgi:hypothetical protein
MKFFVGPQWFSLMSIIQGAQSVGWVNFDRPLLKREQPLVLITVGISAFIGTGAVVLTDVPDYALMVGNPAKQKGWMCTCGIQLVFKGNSAKCMVCKRKYKKLGPEKVVEE